MATKPFWDDRRKISHSQTKNSSNNVLFSEQCQWKSVSCWLRNRNNNTECSHSGTHKMVLFYAQGKKRTHNVSMCAKQLGENFDSHVFISVDNGFIATSPTATHRTFICFFSSFFFCVLCVSFLSRFQQQSKFSVSSISIRSRRV